MEGLLLFLKLCWSVLNFASAVYGICLGIAVMKNTLWNGGPDPIRLVWLLWRGDIRCKK
jgi:hypothetical protein